MSNENCVNIDGKKNIFKRFLLLTPLGDGTAEEALLLWSVISVWLHYVASGSIMVVLFFCALLVPSLRKAVLREKQLFLLGCMISAFSMLTSVIALNLIGMAISFGVLVVIAIGCAVKNTVNTDRIKKVQVICCAGSVASVFLAFYQKFIVYGDNLESYRPTAFAFNANYYGMLIVMTMLICIHNVLDGKRGEKAAWYDRGRLFYIFVFIVNAVALYFNESRSSLLALMVCTVIYLLITRRYILFSAALVLAGAIVTVGWFFPDVLSWTNSLTYSFTHRYEIWMEALRSFSQNPYTVLLGRGPMTYYLVRDAEELVVADHAHNFLIDTLLNVGVIGTAMYLLLFVREILKARRAGNSTGFVLGAVFVLQILVQGIADVNIIWHQCALLFILTFASVGAANEIKSKKDI